MVNRSYCKACQLIPVNGRSSRWFRPKDREIQWHGYLFTPFTSSLSDLISMVIHLFWMHICLKSFAMRQHSSWLSWWRQYHRTIMWIQIWHLRICRLSLRGRSWKQSWFRRWRSWWEVPKERKSSVPTSTASVQTKQDEEQTYRCSNACCAEILTFGSYVNIFDRRSRQSSVAVGNSVLNGCPGTYWYST